MTTNIGGLLAGFTGFIVLVAISSMLVGEFENASTGECVVGLSNIVNSTVSNNVSQFQHGFILSSVITGTDAAGNVTISSANKTDGTCQVLVGSTGSWTSLGYLDNTTAAETFQFTTAQISGSMNLNYSSCQSNNITLANISYNSLTVCSYSYDAYLAGNQVVDYSFTAIEIAGVVAIILIAAVVLNSVGLIA